MQQTRRKKKRRRTDFSRAPVPVGETRIRYSRGAKGDRPQRYIKVRDDGPPQRRWMAYSRFVWEANHGPVPEGMRVAHKDGDLMNDALGNLVLCTPGDVAYLAHKNDPQMSRRNYAKLREATIRHNRERGVVNRALNWLPTRWYAVFPATGEIWNEPRRKRSDVLRLCGINDDWRTARSAAIGWSGRRLLQAVVLLCVPQGAPIASGDLQESVREIYRLAGWRPPTRGAIYSEVSLLRSEGLLTGETGRYESTGFAELHRTRRSPVFTVQGADVDRFAGFEKVDRPSGVCVLCGCIEDNACVDERGACWWAETGLCSHCAEPAPIDQKPTT